LGEANCTIPTFVDLFSGCGGLSLGLINAGWRGVLAVEHDKYAFDTFKTNLLSNNKHENSFCWPDWFPKEPISIDHFLDRYKEELIKLKDTVDMVVGGPPCQGFSTAGRRNPEDPRNRLFKVYMQIVSIINPKIVFLENVIGITLDFTKFGIDSKVSNYSEMITKQLSENYVVFTSIIDVSRYGVPQKRNRFFLVAIRKDVYKKDNPNPFSLLKSSRISFLKSHSLPITRITASQAISDLEVTRNSKQLCIEFPKFEEIKYRYPKTKYQKFMHSGCKSKMHDLRLAIHTDIVQLRFLNIIKYCNENNYYNKSVSKYISKEYGLKKLSLRVLSKNSPAPTITSMPDDLVHYKEPRILTVRENARLQSFPDWFCFKGKYTTGGKLRATEVPRYTQVANAVPPLFAEAVGKVLKTLDLG